MGDTNRDDDIALLNGANANALANNADTPLLIACRERNFGLAIFLIRRGANLNVPEGLLPFRRRPMHYVCWAGRSDVCKLLIDYGASIHIQDNEGQVPLHYASENGHVETAKLLIQNGAWVNSQSNIAWTALHFACAEGHLEVVKLLLRNGANAKYKTEYGLSPLDLACRYRHFNVVFWMVRHFPELMIRN